MSALSRSDMLFWNTLKIVQQIGVLIPIVLVLAIQSGPIFWIATVEGTAVLIGLPIYCKKLYAQWPFSLEAGLFFILLAMAVANVFQPIIVQTWVVVILNAALAAYMLCTLAISKPFTTEYAEELVPRHSVQVIADGDALYYRVNVELTWIWTAVTGISAILAVLPLVLPSANNYSSDILLEDVLPWVLAAIGTFITIGYIIYMKRRIRMEVVAAKAGSAAAAATCAGSAASM